MGPADLRQPGPDPAACSGRAGRHARSDLRRGRYRRSPLMTTEVPPAPRGLALPSYPRPRGVHPPLNSPEYRSSLLRAPKRPLVPLTQGLTEVTGPLLGEERVTAADSDLTGRPGGEPLGERIIVTGQVLDSGGRPVPDTLVEIWQANASGRYAHGVDDHPA